ncbi:uncharacterized protein EV420DRAFT_1619179 [Desarmillaria tabescens]|uniref:Uncharacterized protein n=1 Tax=Armillaria tabescens TaxID=1929756 RepID=A0AA39N9U1_ARMTA|nr:uncharacterized protein EV420DRAFT_1619179 [Desarmillaria tabescens]KAK0461648.1 hypothetical protein EV420DRAFT_1619179 [Desarmillaria tabescens]
MDTPRYYVEQDAKFKGGGDELPTYDDLAAQNGPNSRFGRWRGWVEKRAAERYMDVTPEERARRRERGWGNDELVCLSICLSGPLSSIVLITVYLFQDETSQSSSLSVPPIIQEPTTPTANNYLHIRTEDLNLCTPPPETPRLNSPLPPLPAISTRIRPTHLKMNNFGSRFLPHATAPIRCLLPLLSGRLLLIGHDEGLSVLDMYPQEWSETDVGITIKGPEEAVSRQIWLGEGVYQLSLLEVEQTGEGTPQGVVLALVGPDPNSPISKDVESLRTLRMYNLSSLTSLAKWAVAQKGKRPLDLSRPSNWVAQQSPVKKHRPRSSIARGLKSWIEAPNNHPVEPPTSSYHNLLSPASLIGASNVGSRPGSRSPSPNRPGSDESTWDVINDLPLRWATDFVPLASTGSRLANSSVISYALWNQSDRNTSGRMLAVATKSNILLYETPKGERAFHFVKDFYTPLTPRSITFFQQVVHDVARSPSDTGSSSRFHHGHRRSDSSSTARGDRALTPPNALLSYGTHLSIFVVFDKKAGWIRLADSAVGEVELYDDSAGSSHSRELNSSLNSRRSRYSVDFSSALGKWIPPVQCEIPLPSSSKYPLTKKVHLLTRGKQTHILPCPVPTGTSNSYPPLRVIIWKSPPTSVTPRICSNNDGDSPSRFLQLIALGEHGVEVQEMSVSFLSKGKGKARADDIVYGEDDAGGDTGFLCVGGHWDQPLYPPYQPLNRSSSSASDISLESVNSMESGELLAKMKMDQGLYGWCRKGLEDWRVFWLGGSTVDDDESDEDD